MDKSITLKGDSGAVHQLRFTVNAICTFEEATGGSIIEAAQSLTDTPSMRTIRSFVWAALLHQNENLSLTEAGAIIDDCGGIRTVTPLAGEAFRAAFPSDDGPSEPSSEAEKPTRRTAGNGSAGKGSKASG